MLNGCEEQKSDEKHKTAPKTASGQSGEYWATYSSFPGPPDDFLELGGTGPLYINQITVIEESVEQELANLEFSEGETTAHYANPEDHSEYWAEINLNGEGDPVSVKLSSNAANDFVITVNLSMVEGNLPAYYAQLRSDDGVHSGGGTIPDPYQDPDLPIAGVKELNFKGTHKEGIKIKNTLEEAGYKEYSTRYGNGYYTVSTLKELDSRAKIEETVLKQKDWTPEKDKENKNVGYYKKPVNFTGTITIDWTFSEVPFQIEIKDARLEKFEEGEEEIYYTMSGTAEIKQKWFELGDVVYRLKDEQKKPFCEEYGFKVMTDPEPSVKWDYVECWEYVDESYGTTFMLTVSYTTGDSPTDLSGVPVKALDELDGADTMSFMMPAFGGNATWSFQKE
jgi:hypothetical protein